MTTASDDAAPASWEAAYPELKKIARARLHAAQHGPPGRQSTAAYRERLGRLLLDRGRTGAAQAQLQRVVDDAAVKTWSHVALAQAGLARAALARSAQADAQALSQQALATCGGLSGFRDMRMQPYLWRVRAAVLAAAGDAAGAQALRDQAMAASRRYDAPDSPTVTEPQFLGL